ncbi:MAG: helix-turn-helix domain-containing protein [Desulforhopalus sp.]
MSTIQLDRGKKRFETDACSLGDLTIWKHYTDARIFDRYSPPPGQIEFSFSILPDEANWCGVVLADTVMVVTRGNRDYSVVSPPKMTAYGVTFPEQILKKIDLFPEEFLDAFLIPETAFFNSLNSFTLRLFQHIEEILALTADQKSFYNMETVTFYETIISSLQKVIHGYTVNGNGGENHKTVYKADLIGQTLEIFKANLKQPLSVADVASQLGVSRRSLEIAFDNHLKVSPYSMFQTLRLHAIRELLSAGSSVQEACVEYGITNFGRFAGKFAGHFGVLPSAMPSLLSKNHIGRRS